jgi:hypothetical protein
LDTLSQRYGKAPHEWLELDDVQLAFDYEVMTKAIAAGGSR